MFASDPDRAIYERLRNRDPSAVASLLRRYGSMLALIIFRCLGRGEEEDIKDVLSEVLFSVWTDVEEYDPQRARFRTWLVMKTRYCAFGWHRRWHEGGRHYCPLPVEDVDLSYEEALLRADLAVALYELSELDRQIVYLCDFLDRDREEVATELGIKRGTLNTRLHRVRKRLRRTLAAWRTQQRVPAGDHE